jgi:hypothetical protein
MDFDDIGVRDIAGVKPVSQSQLLKPVVDRKISAAAFASDYATKNAIIISKQPNMERLAKNIGVILENVFHRNAPMQYNGKTMVFITHGTRSYFTKSGVN